jgi:hypothetical protein
LKDAQFEDQEEDGMILGKEVLRMEIRWNFSEHIHCWALVLAVLNILVMYHLVILGLCNDTSNDSDYMASNDGMIGE